MRTEAQPSSLSQPERKSGKKPWLSFSAGQNLYRNGLLLLVALCVLAPVGFLVLGSFSTSDIPGLIEFDEMGLEPYAEVWSDPALPWIFWNTAIYVVSCTVLGMLLAIILAWLVERTDMPGKIWLYAGIPVTLAMPGLLQAMAWILMASPRIGLFNVAAEQVLGVEEPIFNIYSMAGMVFVESLRIVPTAFIMLVPLLRNMDPSLEEAAAASGANPLSTLRKVTLKLMLPGLLAVTIYQFLTAFESFEVPGVIGMPAGEIVISTKIYLLISQTTFLPVYGQANALAMIYLVVAVLATFAYGKAVARSSRFAVVSGKAFRPQLIKLGRGKYFFIGLVWFYMALAVILPILTLIYASFLSTLRAPSWEAVQQFTWANYVAVFQTETITRTITNTLIMTLVASTATCAISLAISAVVVRSSFWGRRLLDQLAFMPSAIPGIVLGLAFVWVFLQMNSFGISLFGSIWSISIAFIVAFLPFGTRSMNAALLQIHRELEEAAGTSGARPWRVMLKIFVPLVMPALVGLWIWCILHSVRIIGIPLLLFDGAENQVLAILMWFMWDEGSVPIVAALGVMLIVFLFIVTLGARWLGFRAMGKS